MAGRRKEGGAGMRIQDLGVSTPALRKTVPRRAGAGFAVPPQEDGEPQAPRAAQDTGHACAPAALLLAAQNEPDCPSPAPDQAAMQRGGALLNAVAALQIAALGGETGLALQKLEALAQTPPTAADPALDSVLQAIAQRAAIELARRRP
jgi:hypothetical protein